MKISIPATQAYRLAVAFIHFKNSYTELAKELEAAGDDYDISEGYPFYLLQFESICPNVQQWCTIQADRLLSSLADFIPNPACLQCIYKNAAKAADGSCKFMSTTDCYSYPTIPFARKICTPLLLACGYDVDKMSDVEMQVAYMSEYAKKVE